MYAYIYRHIYMDVTYIMLLALKKNTVKIEVFLFYKYVLSYFYLIVFRTSCMLGSYVFVGSIKKQLS